jgi:hypothetical protein
MIDGNAETCLALNVRFDMPGQLNDRHIYEAVQRLPITVIKQTHGVLCTSHPAVGSTLCDSRSLFQQPPAARIAVEFANRAILDRRQRGDNSDPNRSSEPKLLKVRSWPNA